MRTCKRKRGTMGLFNRKFKGKKYYINKNKELYSHCIAEAEAENAADVSLYANELYEEKATAEHIVGHYLYWYGKSALKDWKDGLAYARSRGVKETDTDKEVTRILKKLCS